MKDWETVIPEPATVVKFVLKVWSYNLAFGHSAYIIAAEYHVSLLKVDLVYWNFISLPKMGF